MNETVTEITDLPLGFPTSFQQIQEMTLLYSCVVREICTKLENLNQEFKLNHAAIQSSILNTGSSAQTVSGRKFLF